MKPLANIGMSRVDPIDIRPPQILLVQKLSDMTLMVDKNGTQAIPGQYYHTGKQKIWPEFHCHWLFAAKGTYVDKRKPEEGEKPQYQALGVIKDDLTLFGMVFRSSAQYVLSSLFTVAKSQNVPMFVFNVKMETKMLEGEKGSWFVPVCRVGEMVTDSAKFDELYKLAKQFDERADQIFKPEEEE